MKVIAIALAPYNELLVQFQFHVTSSQLLTSLATGNQERESSSPAERDMAMEKRASSSRPIPRRGQVKIAILAGLVNSFLSVARRASDVRPRPISG